MRLHKTLQEFWQGRRRNGQRNRPRTQRKSVRLNLEHLEHRLTPATFNAVDVPSLIADINTANGNGVANTINLSAPSRLYTLNAANNSTDGPTGLPVITSPHLLTINGNFATIERSLATGTPAFRLFDVASGAALMLKNMTLQDGLAKGAGVSAEGGGIYNKGTLTLNGATVSFNDAVGSNGTPASPTGQDAAGGGIWSSGGSLTLAGSTVIWFDFASGGAGVGNGGNAFGAGIYANLTKISIGAGGVIQDCFARGGPGGGGALSGSASGGGLYATENATTLLSVSLANVIVQYNAATGGGAPFNSGGPGSTGGSGSGGGLFVNNCILSLNGDHIQHNSADGGSGGNGANVPGGAGGAGGNGGDAKGGGIYVSGGSLTESNFLLVQNNQALEAFFAGGGGGKGGSGKHGGKGGNGGNAFGGGLYSSGATIKIATSAVFQNNLVAGGDAGPGGNATVSGTAGGNGGSGGNAAGGALYASASGTISLSLQNATVQNNQIYGGYGAGGGKGHAGVNGGSGGNGGNAEGGAVFLAQNATLTNDFIQSNNANLAGLNGFVFGGGGGSGISGGHGGAGGRGAGGGLFVDGGTITLISSTIDSNTAQGGNGGSAFNAPATPGLAGAGGTGTGGGVAIDLGTLTVKSCYLDSNIAEGANGGAHYNALFQITGTAAFQGAGGAGYGGGLFNSGGTLHLTLDDIEHNQANAGKSESGFGSQSTAASGGGLYKGGGTTTIDAYTLAHIINNTDSNNDSHNNIGP